MARTHAEVRAELDQARARYRRFRDENHEVLAKERELHDDIRRLGVEEIEAIRAETKERFF